MFEWLKLLFKKEQFTVLGTQPIYYSGDKGQILSTISITFIIGDKGTRKVILDYEKNLDRIGSPQNHPWYHAVCVPFLRKSGYYQTDSDTIRILTDTLENNANQKLNTGKPTVKKKENNVLHVNFPEKK